MAASTGEDTQTIEEVYDYLMQIGYYIGRPVVALPRHPHTALGFHSSKRTAFTAMSRFWI